MTAVAATSVLGSFSAVDSEPGVADLIGALSVTDARTWLCQLAEAGRRASSTGP
jgi:hypothetical protein